jgi:hypothetical protein
MCQHSIKKITGIGFVIIIILFNFALALEKAVLKGQVLDAEGKAVKGAEIFIYNSPDTRRPADFISARTDSSGKFSVIIPSGKYWAAARLRHGDKYGPLLPGDKHSGEPVEIEVEAGEEVEQDFNVLDLREAARMVKKTREDHYRLEGRIVDKKGAPLKNVYAVADRDKEISEVPDYLSAWTDEGGRYLLYLPAGTYFIGHAAEFPPGNNIYFYREIHISAEKNNLDIIVDQ